MQFLTDNQSNSFATTKEFKTKKNKIYTKNYIHHHQDFSFIVNIEEPFLMKQ